MMICRRAGVEPRNVRSAYSGSHLRMESSSDRAPSSASRRMSAAVKVLVALPNAKAVSVADGGLLLHVAHARVTRPHGPVRVRDRDRDPGDPVPPARVRDRRGELLRRGGVRWRERRPRRERGGRRPGDPRTAIRAGATPAEGAGGERGRRGACDVADADVRGDAGEQPDGDPDDGGADEHPARGAARRAGGAAAQRRREPGRMRRRRSLPASRRASGRPARKTSSSSRAGVTSSWSYRQPSGRRSSRQRTKLVACRKRSPCRWSYATSTTRSGASGTQSSDRPRLQRLSPPGMRMGAPSSSRGIHGCGASSPSARGASSAANAARRSRLKPEATPTWWSEPASSWRPRSSEPTHVPGPSLCQRNPPTTQSAVRACFTFTIARLPGSYGPVRTLGDDAVETRTLEPSEPVGGDDGVRRDGRQVDRRDRAGHRDLEQAATLGERSIAEVVGIEREQVPRDERRRRLAPEHGDPRRGGVDPLEERVEVEHDRRAGRGSPRDDDLAVDHASLRQAADERLGQLGEVAVERLQVPALDEGRGTVAEDDGAEPVPLGLVQPPGAVRDLAGRRREHRAAAAA